MNTITQQRLNPILFLTFLATFVSACASQQTAPIAANKAAPITNEDLTSKKWQLVSIAQPGKSATTTLRSGPPASRFNFQFVDGRIVINGGCNNLSGRYRLAANNGIALGPMISTKKACSPRSLMEADNEILSYISGVTSYALNGRALTLVTAFKQRLVFKGTATAQARYGEGVRKFIEIVNSDQGIQWREAKYNSNWIRIKDNASWETVYPGIQGFIPENNRKYIVRIYEHIDPQTQQAIWIKDMVTSNGIIG